MTDVRFLGLPTEIARAFQAGSADANGQSPERHISDGAGVPCRHCLREIPKGEEFLIVSYRPFPAPQPYAEVGPIFLHAEPCEGFDTGRGTPPICDEREHFLLRGYNARDRIIYGTGQIVATDKLSNTATQLFECPDVAYLHLRSASNNCYQCRIERA